MVLAEAGKTSGKTLTELGLGAAHFPQLRSIFYRVPDHFPLGMLGMRGLPACCDQDAPLQVSLICIIETVRGAKTLRCHELTPFSPLCEVLKTL